MLCLPINRLYLLHSAQLAELFRSITGQVQGGGEIGDVGQLHGEAGEV